MSIYVVAASALAGFVSSLGLGGGGILILFLTLFLDMAQMRAGGINLLFFLPIASIAICIHIRNHLIDYKFALKCAPFGAAGALVGVYLASRISPDLIAKAFAVFVLVLGIRELFSKTDPREK